MSVLLAVLLMGCLIIRIEHIFMQKTSVSKVENLNFRDPYLLGRLNSRTSSIKVVSVEQAGREKSHD